MRDTCVGIYFYKEKGKINHGLQGFRHIGICLNITGFDLQGEGMGTRQEELMESYFREKDISHRYTILKQLLLDVPTDAKDFFLNAFRKERYLDMKLSAVRGYAAYATEAEVSVLMNKLLELLKKRAEKIPYNYTEYEPMRSVFLMPYLLAHYDYECFRVFDVQLEKLYDEMPACFKDIFTLDESGNVLPVRDKEDVEKSRKDFLGK